MEFDISLESILDTTTPEILGLFDDNRLLMPHNGPNTHGIEKIIELIYSYLPKKPIIEILHEIRENQNTIIYKSREDALMNMMLNNSKIAYILEKIDEMEFRPAFAKFECSRAKIHSNIVSILDSQIEHLSHEESESESNSESDSNNGEICKKCDVDDKYDKYNNRNDESKQSTNMVSFKLKKDGETIESLVIDDFSKIKNIKIMSDPHCVLFDSADNLDYTQTKKYLIHGANEIEGLLISNYNIPMMSILYDEVYMEIDFDDDYEVDEIGIIYTILDKKILNALEYITYELDTQPGRFLVFGGGMMGEHFTRDNGDLAKKYVDKKLNKKMQTLFDSAHLEANKRKTLNKNVTDL